MNRIFVIVIIVLSALTAQSQIANNTQTSLFYLTRPPKLTSEKPPLLILLHGVGSNEKDLFSFAEQLPGNFLVLSVRAPYTIGRESFAWYQIDFSTGKAVYDLKQEENSRNMLIDFITDLKKKLTFDDKHVYLCGFSQGAIMSYSIGLTRPELVKGIAIMSGRLLEEIKPLIASKEKLKQLRIFVSHGTNDNTLSIQYARSGLEYLKTLGLNPSYKEYVEGHGINKVMLTDLIDWLKK